MTFGRTDDADTVRTMSKNYISINHEYFEDTDPEQGLRTRNVDVWFAYKPDEPSMQVFDTEGKEVPVMQITMTPAWTVRASGTDDIHIYGREDIKGLRKLLDALEAEFDRSAMEALTAEFRSEQDNDDRD